MPHLRCCLACGVLLQVILLKGAKAEFYSSVDSMQDLFHLEKDLINATRSYLRTQQQQLDLFDRFVKQVKEEHMRVVSLPELKDYLGHPLHSFRLIKRLVFDWDSLIHNPIVSNEPREEFQKSFNDLTENVGYPNSSELLGAVKGLSRLQKVYNLTSKDLADGVINEFAYDSQLEWYDCYEIGVQLFDIGDYKASVEWLEAAMIFLKEMPIDRDTNQYMSDIAEYAALANIEMGNFTSAQSLLNTIIEPSHGNTAQQSLKYLEATQPRKTQLDNDFSWFSNYSSLCQGKRFPENGSLQCYLDGKRHPYFVLAPLKVEPVHLDPAINVYHGILSSQQIADIFKESDKEERIRSGVAGDNGDRTIKDIRVSQQTWLNYSSPIMKHVSRMNEFISGLTMLGSEQMQVANYGVGGQYEPHPDYFGPDVPSDFEGDRISTSMFYLSSVEQGGYTVFPSLNVFLPPVQGSMVMWHNLHFSLDVDARTWHAGCPVIVGSKRIGNIWLHAGHQMFRRPCHLSSDSHKSLAYHYD